MLQEEYIAKTAEILKTYGELKKEIKDNNENVTNVAKLGIKNMADMKS
jgi:hypothetical protein